VSAGVPARRLQAPRPWVLSLARAYTRRRVQRGLDGLYVAGLEAAREHSQKGPLLIAANHTSWWDPLLALLLDDALGGGGRALMDQQNLERLPFFGWLGALPLDRRTGPRARAGMQLAVDHLRESGQKVWIYPQGRQRPSWVRPLDLHRGVAVIARLSGAPVLPVSVAYGFREHHLPAAFVQICAPLAHDHPDLLAGLEQALIAGLARCDAGLEGATGFTALIAPQGQQDQDGVGARLLARFARPAAAPGSP
jgi:1-acyl-sn-glycerol-3-phosphate acyltransferase